MLYRQKQSLQCRHQEEAILFEMVCITPLLAGLSAVTTLIPFTKTPIAFLVTNTESPPAVTTFALDLWAHLPPLPLNPMCDITELLLFGWAINC